MLKHVIDRRKAIKLLGVGSAALLSHGCVNKHTDNSHIITLSFDDRFEKSTRKTIEIYEKYGLKAYINVIATPHQKDFQLGKLKDAEYIKIEKPTKGNYPLTLCNITEKGISAYEQYVHSIKGYFDKSINVKNRRINPTKTHYYHIL